MLHYQNMNNFFNTDQLLERDFRSNNLKQLVSLNETIEVQNMVYNQIGLPNNDHKKDINRCNR